MSSSSELFQNDYTVLKQCRHGYFAFNRNDRFVGRALDLYGEWCEREIATIAQLVRPGDFVVDIGANIGTHTIALAKMVTASGLVIAVEAQRQMFNYLVTNVTLNNLLHVICMNNAAGETAGAVRVPLLTPSAENNFGAVSLAGQESGEPIPMITVDSLKLARCRLIKIDVEGMEPQVLAGARRTIERLRPFLFVEATMENSREVIRLLTQFGYDCRWHIASYYSANNYLGNGTNVFDGVHPETNLVCLPREAKIDATGLEPISGPDDNWQKAVERIMTRNRAALEPAAAS